MIAGRLHWKATGAALPGKNGLAAFDFASGTLTLTEAGSKRRASLHAVEGAEALAAIDPGGVDVLAIDRDGFAAVLQRERHTLERALTDPRLFSGIGSAYSDEILHLWSYCPTCQTDGTLLADRALSRLLRGDWPRSLEELESYKADRAGPAGPAARRDRRG